MPLKNFHLFGNIKYQDHNVLSIKQGCSSGPVVETVLADPWQGTVPSALSVCLTSFSGFFSRVINAGKSTHNEDQASCEVLTVKKKAGAVTSTPNRNSSKRRSSLPNGEGLQLKENSVRPFLILGFQVRRMAHTLVPLEDIRASPKSGMEVRKQCPQS